jgi:hypothetical protein
MTSLDTFVRGRAAQYLFERAYPVNDIPEGGVSAEGYSVFLYDGDGNRIIDFERGEMKTEERPWRDPEHWAGLERIMKGEW